MNKFIKPATLTVPKEIYDFLKEVNDYYAENDITMYDMIDTIVKKEQMDGIEIIYED